MDEARGSDEPSAGVAVPGGWRRGRLALFVPLALLIAIGLGVLSYGSVGGGAAGDGWLFIGRFHPLVLHLPIGGASFLLFVEAMALARRRPWRRRATAPAAARRLPRIEALAFTVLGAVIAAALGFALGQDTGYGADLLIGHFRWGVIFTLLSAIALTAAILHERERRRWTRAFYASSLAGMLLSLAVAGHLGAAMTHGETYLTDYAPPAVKPWLETVLGIDPRDAASTSAGAAALEALPLEQRPAYAAQVQPLLAATCYECHGPTRQRGGLRLDSIDAMLAGGGSGPALVPGRPDESLMVRLIELPADHDEHMPPPSKPQPQPEDVALIRAWIAAGATDTVTVGDLGLATGTTIRDPSVGEEAVPQADPERRAALEGEVERINAAIGAGVPLGFVSRGGTDLQFNAHSLGPRLSADVLEQLTMVAGDVVELNLSFTPLDADMAERLPTLPRLARLNVAATPVDDRAIATLLERASGLQTLIAYDTRLTDASLERFLAHPSLKRVVLTGSAVSAVAVEEARRRRSLEIVTGE